MRKGQLVSEHMILRSLSYGFLVQQFNCIKSLQAFFLKSMNYNICSSCFLFLFVFLFEPAFNPPSQKGYGGMLPYFDFIPYPMFCPPISTMWCMCSAVIALLAWHWNMLHYMVQCKQCCLSYFCWMMYQIKHKHVLVYLVVTSLLCWAKWQLPCVWMYLCLSSNVDTSSDQLFQMEMFK